MGVPSMQLLAAKAAATGPFDPDSIAGLHAWFDADAITGKVNNDTVSTWADSSGNGYDATAPTGQDPLYRTNILNSLPVVNFTATNEKRLTTASWMALSQPNTVFVVGKIKDTAVESSQLYDGIGASNRHLLSEASNSTTSMFYFAGSSVVFTAPVSMATAPQIAVTVFNSTSSNTRVGGGAGSAGDAGTHTLTGLTLGNRYASSFQSCEYIAELLLYDSALSVADINDVGDYLAAKWGLTWTTAT